jgi:DNA-binding IclR family transcriptional regulator
MAGNVTSLPAATPVRARYRVQVLDRSFHILDALASARDEVSPGELATALRLHKSTVHRLLTVLEHQRFIRRTPDGRYGLGTKLIAMGSRAMDQLDLGEHAVRFLRGLVVETGETGHISVLSGTEMMSIAHVAGRWTLTTPSTVGRRTHIYCTSGGKALMAFLPEDRLEPLLATLQFAQHTRRTITSSIALRTELARIRRRGYAVDNEEGEEGMRCIGAPVRDYTGQVVASISIAGPIFRMRKGRVPELSRAVIKAANDLSADLGYVPRKSVARSTNRSSGD